MEPWESSEIAKTLGKICVSRTRWKEMGDVREEETEKETGKETGKEKETKVKKRVRKTTGTKDV